MEQQDSDKIYNDPASLFTAMTQGNPDLPVPAFPSISVVKHHVSDFVGDIFSSWNMLNGILERYEEVLRKRWGKKTGTQRRVLLLTAWPNMPATHRPEFQALQLESVQQRHAGSEFRDWFLLPLINLEDMIKIRNLPLLLNARGRNKPDIFANTDFNAAQIGTINLAFVSNYLQGYTMLLSGQKDASTYGQLISWDENDEAFDWMSSGVGIQPGEGLLVLESQQKLLRFLVQIARLILHELPLDDMNVPVKPPPPALGSINGDGEWDSLISVLMEAPYRVPGQLDFLRMQSLVYAKCAQAKDHVWLLREDPAYFSDVVRAWSEHRQEKILSVNGKTHPILRLPFFWERVLGSVIVDAYCNMFTWDVIWQQLTKLGQLKDRYALQSFQSLPKDVECALAHFSFLLRQSCAISSNNLSTGLVGSPPLRQHYVRKPQGPNTTLTTVFGKYSTDGDYLLWLLDQLLIQDKPLFYGLQNLLDEVERHVHNDAEQRKRISPWVAENMSDLGILGELQRQLALSGPGPRMTVLVPEDELQKDLTKVMMPYHKIRNAFNASYRLADVYKPLRAVDYPSDKKRTKATTEKMRKAEKDLFAFWLKADEHVVKQTRGTTVQEILPEVGERIIHTTSMWIEPTTIEEDNRTDVAAAAEAFPTRDLEEHTERTQSPSQPLPNKAKIQIRGVGSESVPGEDLIAEDAVATEDTRPRFTVSKRDYKVYATLFRPPTEDGLPGEVPWTDFLHALSSVGFSVEKLHGSAWIFRRTHEAPERSIIFHEPHPSSKIPFRTARHYGRRLEWAYGWSRETFIKPF